MKHTIKHVLKTALLCALLLPGIASAQDNMIFLGRNTPQKFLINPALTPENARFFISMPILGGLGVNYSGNLSFYDVFSLNSSNQAFIDPQHLLKHVKENTTLRNILNVDILNMGFHISRNGIMGITLRGRTSIDMSFTKDALSFILDNPLERTGLFNIALTPDALSWGELGISYSHKVSKNFTVGARVKGIMGGVSAQSSNLSIRADKSLSKYVLQGDINLLAGNLNLKKDGSNRYDIKNLSPGFGLDLGVSYLSDNKRIQAYASLSDFGRIYWSDKGSSRISSKNPSAKYDWTGIKDLDGLINGKSFQDVFENTMDEMTAVIGIDTVKTAFTSNLPSTIQMGGQYAIDSKLMHNVSLNILSILPQYAKTYYEFTAGYTYRSKNKRWDLMAAYTYKSLNPVNFGLGGLYRGKGFEIFLMTDSINSLISYQNAQSANIRFGMNFYVPIRKYKKVYRDQVIW